VLEEEWRGRSKDEVLRKLQRTAAQLPADRIVIKDEGETIWFDELQFNFEQGRLSSIGGPPSKE
jgi:hypothetical protein